MTIVSMAMRVTATIVMMIVIAAIADIDVHLHHRRSDVRRAVTRVRTAPTSEVPRTSRASCSAVAAIVRSQHSCPLATSPSS